MKIKFISLNVWIGGVLFDNIVDFLKKEDADIVVLQEVLQSNDKALPVQYRTLDVLKDRLGYHYATFQQMLIDDFPWGEVANGHAILSKFPIVSSSGIHFDDKTSTTHSMPFDPAAWPLIPRGIQHAVIDSPAGDLNIINFQGVWDLDGDNASAERERMVATILREIKDKKHVIVAGDTNARYTNPAMRIIEEQLTNVFGDSLATTFNMRRKTNPGYATSVVDMIYTSADFTTVERNCPDVDVSDHLPLVATLEITDNKE